MTVQSPISMALLVVAVFVGMIGRQSPLPMTRSRVSRSQTKRDTDKVEVKVEKDEDGVLGPQPVWDQPSGHRTDGREVAGGRGAASAPEGAVELRASNGKVTLDAAVMPPFSSVADLAPTLGSRNSAISPASSSRRMPRPEKTSPGS